MKIKLRQNVNVAGVGAWVEGEIVECNEETAKILIEGGLASLQEHPEVRSTTTVARDPKERQ